MSCHIPEITHEIMLLFDLISATLPCIKEDRIFFSKNLESVQKIISFIFQLKTFFQKFRLLAPSKTVSSSIRGSDSSLLGVIIDLL